MLSMVGYEEIQVILPDGYGAYARYWSPPSPRGAVLYHHGIQSHCGWYGASAERLAQAGYAVLQVDRRGCGRNEQDRGHAESADQLIADALAGRDELTRRCGLADHHIVGVSWGGKLAVAVYVTDPARVKSLTLVTPGLFPQVGVSKAQMAKIGFAMLYEPHSLFDIPLNEPERFSSDPRWQEFFKTDALTLRQCTAGFYLASRRMDRIISRLGETDPVPIHLMLAGDERIIDNNKTRAYVTDLAWRDTRITDYPAARHALEFDVPDQFLADLTSFINDVSRR